MMHSMLTASPAPAGAAAGPNSGGQRARGSELTFSVTIAGRTYPLTFFSNLWQGEIERMFGGKQYPKVSFVSGVRAILDIGAHIGLAAVYLKATYPDAKIFSFEPDPDTFRILRKNTAQFGGIETFNYGLFDRNATARLNLGTVNETTNSIGRSILNGNEFHEIALHDIGGILERENIATVDLVKIDTEGCELPILRRLRDRLREIKVIYLEYHSEDCRREIDALLGETHVLFSGHVLYPHRGELCYVARNAFPVPQEADRMRISIDPSCLGPAQESA
jgi:FkbM family methyltransferase